VSRLASPRLLSVHYASFVAGAVVRLGLAVARHLAADS